MKYSTRWLTLAALTFAACLRPSASVITIDDNGYRGVVVAVHKDVPEDPKLIDNIKSTLISASSVLFTATRRRAYFEEISIIVPGTWSFNSSYQQIQGGNLYQRSHVRIVKSTSLPAGQDQPFTKQVGDCGEEGEYVQMTTDFINRKVETIGNVFVHEWAHFRYGVFDEYNDEEPFMYDENRKIRLVGCPKGVQGWAREKDGKNCTLAPNQLPNKNCAFFPYNKTITSHSSIMFLTGYQKVDQFCDETPELKHDGSAPNKHNLKCRGKSTWEVVSNHKDFRNGKNPSSGTLQSPLPNFRILQTKKNPQPTIVLVLDVSDSMKGKRLALQKAAASRFIQYHIIDGSSLGIVEFGTISNPVVNITHVNRTTRADLVKKIPSSTKKRTCIGCGIVRALEMLKGKNEPTEGALVVLITDGEENEKPYLKDIEDQIKDSRVIINAVAFGNQASDRLEGLIKLTGGRGFFYDDKKVSHKILDSALIESAITHCDLELQPVQIVNKGIRLKFSKIDEGSVVVDKDVSRNVEFILTLESPDADAVEFKLTSPENKVYNENSTEYEFDSLTTSIRIKFDEAESGKWSYWIKNNKNHNQEASLTVTGEPLDVKDQPVRVQSRISDVEVDYPKKVKFYAKVWKGGKVVVNATVVAKIYRPNGPPEELKLKDNGADPDSTKNDGFYSGYFTFFNGTGRYSVETTVVNDKAAKLKLDDQGSKAWSKYISFRLPAGAENWGEPSDSFSPDEMIIGREVDEATEPVNEEFEDLYPFERSASAGSVKVNDWTEGVDKLGPARVTDLKIDRVSKKDWTFGLSWTSPGDNLYDGKVKLIELKCHWNPELLLSSFEMAIPITGGNVTSGDFNPMEGGTKHRLVLHLPPSPSVIQDNGGGIIFDDGDANWPMGRLCFGLRSEDSAGNKADLSNIATANLPNLVSQFQNSSGSEPMGLSLWLILVLMFTVISVLR